MRSLARRVHAADGWALLLVLALLSPLRRAGYPLGRDMVFTPHQPFSAASLGLGSAAPRAVPLDAVIAAISRIADGAVTGRIVLPLGLLAAGCGAWRLLPAGASATRSPARSLAEIAAAGFAVWNPFVVERLALGQWALLWAYGAMPWLILAGRAVAVSPRAPRSVWAAMILLLAASSITPTGGIIASCTLLAVAWRRSASHVAALFAVVVVTQLPWLVPAFTAPAGLTSDPAGVSAFAARSERPGGVLLSLLGLGGIWDSGSTPASRSGVLGYLTTVMVIAGLAVGFPVMRQRSGRWFGRFALVSFGGLALAGLTAFPGGAALLRLLIRTVPGAGLLRDGQKWLLPFVLLAVVCCGAAVERAARGVRGALPLVFAAAFVLPLLLLPDAIATLRPTLTPAHYPEGWYSASSALRSSRAPGEVLSLPFAAYRSFSWVAASSVIDPVPRWVSRAVVVDDRLAVAGRLLGGEDPRAAALARILERDNRAPEALARDLAGAGIGWVWMQTDTPGPPLPDLSALRQVSVGAGVTLYAVPGVIHSAPASFGRRAVVLAADLLALILVIGALLSLAVQGARACYTRR